MPPLERRTYFSIGGTIDASGNATLTPQAVPLDTRWAVERIVTVGAGAASPILSVYRNAVADANLVEGTLSTSGNRDFADESAPIYFEEGETLILRYTGGTSGAPITANVQYRQSRISAGRRRHIRHAVPGAAVSQWDAGKVRKGRAGQHPTAVS